MRLFRPVLLAGLVLATSATPALGATRYAAPNGSTAGDCSTPMLACRIDYAVNSAPADSDVVVPSGDYQVDVALSPVNRITLRGTGATRPRLIGGSGTPSS